MTIKKPVSAIHSEERGLYENIQFASLVDQTGLHSYGFDLELSCSLHVKATSHEHALRILRDKLDCADSNLGLWPDGSPILCETSLRGTPELYEVDDEERRAPPPIVFEPGRIELVRVLQACADMLDGEEDSVRQEHASLITLVNTTLYALQDFSRQSELSVFLRLLYRDTGTDASFNGWLLRLADNQNAHGQAQALEYLALDGVRAQVEADGEMNDEDDEDGYTDDDTVAAWMKQRHGLRFMDMSDEQQDHWRERFFDARCR